MSLDRPFLHKDTTLRNPPVDLMDIVVVMFVIWYFGGVEIYLAGTMQNPIFRAKWIIMAFAAIAIMAVCNRPSMFRRLPWPLLYWTLLYVAISIVWRAAFPDTLAAEEEFKDRRVATVFLLTAMVLLADVRAVTVALRTVAGVVLVGVVLNIYDFLAPGTLGVVPHRGSGFYVNPNQSGIALGLGLIVSIAVIPEKLRKLWVIFVGVGTIVTFSRGSIVCYGLAIFFLTYRGLLGNTKPLPILVTASLAFAGFLSASTAIRAIGDLSLDYLNANMLHRIQFFVSFNVDDPSATLRLQVAKHAFADFLDNPLAGHGLSNNVFGFNIGSHNMYVAMLWQHGLFGILLLVLFFVAFMDRAREPLASIRTTFLLYIAGESIFSHNLFGQRAPLFIAAVLASWLALERRNAALMPTMRVPPARV